MTRATLLLVLLSLVACGGTVVDVDGGADSGSETGCTDCFDGGGGPFACGNTTCSGADAVCVHPCCGGAMICAPLEDGGTCPSGLQLSQQCPPDSPCTNVCTPPPPYCATAKDCTMVQGHDCYLLCQ